MKLRRAVMGGIPWRLGNLAGTSVLLASAVALSTGTAIAGTEGAVMPSDSQLLPVTTVDTDYPTSQGREAMTVYFPAGVGPSTPTRAPAIVMVHGGAWMGGSRALLDSEAREAALRGFVVFNIDYAVDVPRSPRQYQQVTAAVDYVHSHADNFGIDADRIGGLGTSAGAHLLMQSVTVDHVPLEAVVGWSGPYDLSNFSTPANSAIAIAAAGVYLGCDPISAVAAGSSSGVGSSGSAGSCADQAAEASPIRHVSAGSPPALLFNSATEVIPVEQMTSFAEKLRSVGVQADTRVIPGSKHAVAYSDAALDPTLTYLGRHLGLL
ncbi:alpha/beta hydrolase fold domain-containing protein [Rhodococcus sp. ACT016]|uniref:alpha/beta hydrolase fold domain-containing protein n=1 Tax=Rhodococcus sp. ACT016 TaxID=3134808 RepID=UPI003D26C04E